MKRNQPWLYITIIVLLAGVVTLTGCGTVITKADPVTLTLWHVYGEQTDSPLNDLVDEFNKLYVESFDNISTFERIPYDDHCGP